MDSDEMLASASAAAAASAAWSAIVAGLRRLRAPTQAERKTGEKPEQNTVRVRHQSQGANDKLEASLFLILTGEVTKRKSHRKSSRHK